MIKRQIGDRRRRKEEADVMGNQYERSCRLVRGEFRTFVSIIVTYLFLSRNLKSPP